MAIWLIPMSYNFWIQAFTLKPAILSIQIRCPNRYLHRSKSGSRFTVIRGPVKKFLESFRENINTCIEFMRGMRVQKLFSITRTFVTVQRLTCQARNQSYHTILVTHNRLLNQYVLLIEFSGQQSRPILANFYFRSNKSLKSPFVL